MYGWYAWTKGKPALRLRESPRGREIARIPYHEAVEVLDWDDSSDWAVVSYQDIKGYVMKSYLDPMMASDPDNGEEVDLPDEEPACDAALWDALLVQDKPYIVLQVRQNGQRFCENATCLPELEKVINEHAVRGYRLHTCTTTEQDNVILATLVFEKR